jgi:hypothetical protein
VWGSTLTQLAFSDKLHPAFFSAEHNQLQDLKLSYIPELTRLNLKKS